MNLGVFLLLLLALPALAGPAATPRDPYQGIEIYRLPNLTQVVLAPSRTAETVEIRVEVKAGQFQDPPGKSGVAHLLEHYLFTSEKLAPDSTFMDLVREKGGGANGMTRAEDTVYYATVPRGNAAWIVDTFQKMLIRENFTPTAVESAKKPVYLEIGRATPADYANDLLFRFAPFSLPRQGIWQKEFGFEQSESQNSRNADKINTREITAADLQTFYANYYRPENTTILLAGGFSAPAMKKKIAAAFGEKPNLPGLSPQESVGAPRIRPYQLAQVTHDTPRVFLGTKVAFATAQQKLTGEIYLNYLAHRLMKELRNRKGETYSAYDQHYYRRNHGILTVRFDTSVAQYKGNLKAARALLARETSGEITPEDFETAKKFFEATFNLNDNDAETRLAYAQGLLRFREYFGDTFPTPFAAFQSLNFETYRAELKHLFRPEMRYELRIEPPLFFRYDTYLAYVLGLAFAALATRRYYLRKFAHREVRWVRKIQYPPFYLVQLINLAAIATVTYFASHLLDTAWQNIGLAGKSPLVSEYARKFLLAAFAVGIYQFYMSLLMRKAIIAGDQLWLKSLGYHSTVHNLHSITALHVIHPSRLFTSPKLLARVGFRFYYYFHPHFWQKGLLVELSTGKCIYLALAEAKMAAVEIRALLPPRETKLKLVA